MLNIVGVTQIYHVSHFSTADIDRAVISVQFTEITKLTSVYLTGKHTCRGIIPGMDEPMVAESFPFLLSESHTYWQHIVITYEETLNRRL